VAHLDFGTSYVFAEPVLVSIASRLPVSVYFGILGFIATYSVSIPLGVLKAIKHGSRFDTLTSVLVFIGYSLPGWAVGAILLVLLGGGSFWDVFPLGEFRSENWSNCPSSTKSSIRSYHTILPESPGPSPVRLSDYFNEELAD
jgi:microcin C transport system permease protein